MQVPSKRCVLYTTLTLTFVLFLASSLIRPGFCDVDVDKEDDGHSDHGDSETTTTTTTGTVLEQPEVDPSSPKGPETTNNFPKKSPTEDDTRDSSQDNGEGKEADGTDSENMSSISADPNDDKNSTFDRLYTEGIKAYNDQLWYSCAYKIERAIDDYRAYSTALTTCRLECNQGLRTTKLLNFSSSVEGFAAFFHFMKIADCFRRCKQDLIGQRSPVSDEIEYALEERSPYLYLQYCYFKVS